MEETTKENRSNENNLEIEDEEMARKRSKKELRAIHAKKYKPYKPKMYKPKFYKPIPYKSPSKYYKTRFEAEKRRGKGDRIFREPSKGYYIRKSRRKDKKLFDELFGR